MRVYVAYDFFNEEVLGVFSTIEKALAYQERYPSPGQLDIEQMTVDEPRLIEAH